jgi:hypothetical protein
VGNPPAIDFLVGSQLLRVADLQPACDPADRNCSVIASRKGMGNPDIKWNWTALPALHNVAL